MVGHRAVDDAVIERETQRGDVADGDRVAVFGLDHPWPFVNAAQSEDGHLRLVDDRRGGVTAEEPEVGDREGSARDLVRFELLAARAIGQVLRSPRQPRQAQRVGLFDDWHDQAPVERDGDADVVIVFVGDVLALDRRVYYRKRLERVDRGLDDERQECQLRAVLRFELFLHALAQPGDVREIDLENGGDVRRNAPAVEHVLRDPAAHIAHRLDGHAVAGRERRSRRRGWGCGSDYRGGGYWSGRGSDGRSDG